MTVLPHSVTLPVLGIRTRFETNEPAMLEIVDEAFSVWRVLGGNEGLDEEAERVVQVRIEIVSDDRDHDLDTRGAPMSHEMSDDLRFVARCADSVATSDPSRRLATIRATHGLVADRARFRTERRRRNRRARSFWRRSRHRRKDWSPQFPKALRSMACSWAVTANSTWISPRKS